MVDMISEIMISAIADFLETPYYKYSIMGPVTPYFNH